jgi:hypothetical protein
VSFSLVPETASLSILGIISLLRHKLIISVCSSSNFNRHRATPQDGHHAYKKRKSSSSSCITNIEGKGQGRRKENWCRCQEKLPSQERLRLQKENCTQEAKVNVPFDIINSFKSQQIPVYKIKEEYEQSVATSNLLYRFSRPHCVVCPKNRVHVQKIVRQEKSQNIPVTIKNGGHSYAGGSTADKGILLDLVKMNKVRLDIKSKTTTLEGCAKWGNAYRALINGRHDGYVINGGRKRIHFGERYRPVRKNPRHGMRRFEGGDHCYRGRKSSYC